MGVLLHIQTILVHSGQQHIQSRQTNSIQKRSSYYIQMPNRSMTTEERVKSKEEDERMTEKVGGEGERIEENDKGSRTYR